MYRFTNLLKVKQKKLEGPRLSLVVESNISFPRQISSALVATC